MYNFTDKIVKSVRRRYVRVFNSFLSNMTAKTDELNILTSSKMLYRELDSIARKSYYLIARQVYKANKGEDDDFITMAWVLGWLNAYNPVTKCVYTHEIERKCARFAESVIASNAPLEEINTALKQVDKMFYQYALDVTDHAYIDALRSRNIKFVQWITNEDERRCAKCAKLHGEVFRIDKIPTKPHYNCRCYVIPYKGVKNNNGK